MWLQQFRLKKNLISKKIVFKIVIIKINTYNLHFPNLTFWCKIPSPSGEQRKTLHETHLWRWPVDGAAVDLYKSRIRKLSRAEYRLWILTTFLTLLLVVVTVLVNNSLNAHVGLQLLCKNYLGKNIKPVFYFRFCSSTYNWRKHWEWKKHSDLVHVKKVKQGERKAKNVNILFTKLLFFFLFFFCHTESKNVATTLICATGSHTKNHGLLVAQLL